MDLITASAKEFGMKEKREERARRKKFKQKQQQKTFQYEEVPEYNNTWDDFMQDMERRWILTGLEKEEEEEMEKREDEMIQKRKFYKLEKSYRIIGSIKDTLCNHHNEPCSCPSCYGSTAIAYKTINTGPKTGRVHYDKFRNVLYCQRHLRQMIQLAKQKDDLVSFHLLECSFCSREAFTICSNCSIVFQVPDFVESYFCPNCKHCY